MFMVFADKFNYKAPEPCKIDSSEIVDKMLYEPLPNVIAHMMETGSVASEYRRRKNSAIYDSKMTKDGNLDELAPMPMYGLDLVDAQHMRSSAIDYFDSRKKESEASASASSAPAPASDGVNNG